MVTPAAKTLAQRMIDGLTAFRQSGEPRSISEHEHGRLRAAQVTAVMHYAPAVLTANIGNALVLTAALSFRPHPAPIYVWLVVILGYLFVFQRRHFWRVRGAKPTLARSRRSVDKAILNAAIQGVIWAPFPSASSIRRFPTTSSSSAFAPGCSPEALWCWRPLPAAAFAFMAPIAAGSMIGFVGGAHQAPENFAAPLLISYLIILSHGALAHGRQFAERVVLQERAERAAQHDSLTGLANRAAFEEELAAAFGRLERHGERFALMLLDLDHFKAINDALGHQAGDQLLRQVAGRLSGASRASEMVARIGGDEFVLILRGSADASEIARRAECMSQCFEAPFALDGLPTRSSASIGVAQAPLDGENTAALVSSADAALYRAKRRRQTSARAYSNSEDRRALERRTLAHDLVGAVSRGEFFLEYQPIQSLAINRLEACEALVRWRHPTLGLISPARFISIAEDTGAIHELGEWIAREACAQAARWPDEVAVAVNVSAHQICDRSIVRVVERALQDTGLPATRLHVEITESAMLRETKALAESVTGLANLAPGSCSTTSAPGFHRSSTSAACRSAVSRSTGHSCSRRRPSARARRSCVRWRGWRKL